MNEKLQQLRNEIQSLNRMQLTPKELVIYYDGVRDGINQYAYMRDGVFYVGTTGRTRRDAFNAIDAAEEKLFETIFEDKTK